MRTIDVELIRKAIGDYAEEIKGLILEDWVLNPRNVALTNGDDVAMFERQWQLPKTVAGHYFFTSRGKGAIAAATSFLHEIFTGPYDVEIIVGLTPVEHKAALWMNKRLGFKEHGDVDTDAGLHRFVILTKQEWLQQKEVANE